MLLSYVAILVKIVLPMSTLDKHIVTEAIITFFFIVGNLLVIFHKEHEKRRKHNQTKKIDV